MDISDECSVLKEFYGPSSFAFEVEGDSVNSGIFICKVSLPNGAELVGPPIPKDVHLVLSPAPKQLRPDSEELIYSVSVLPPVYTEFSKCPADGNPDFLFKIRCTWLTHNQLDAVESHINRLFIENRECSPLATCLGFVEHELLGFCFSRCASDADCVIKFSIIDTNDSLNTSYFKDILQYNEIHLREIDPNRVYECDVCTCAGTGKNFYRFFDCGHMFCNDCILTSFKSQVESGANNGNPTCLSCDKAVAQYEIRRVLPRDSYQRYEELSLRRALSQMEDIAQCPRSDCLATVLLDNPDLGQCPECGIAFCPRCGLTYHGKESCKKEFIPRDYTQEEVLEILKGEDCEEKQRLVKKLGEKYLQNHLNELQSDEYMATRAQRCPGCYIPIQRLFGCNFMTCVLCRTTFCWLCLRRLKTTEHLSHFSSGDCSGRLFAPHEIDENQNDEYLFD